MYAMADGGINVGLCPAPSPVFVDTRDQYRRKISISISTIGTNTNFGFYRLSRRNDNSVTYLHPTYLCISKLRIE